MLNALLELFREWFGRETVPTRLSFPDALAIARASLPEADRELLQMATPCVVEGRVLWVVSQAARGHVLVVEVDDETGKVLSSKRVGVR